MDNSTLQMFTPGLSALLGGVAAGVGAFYAMRIELAILRTRIEGLKESLAGMREDIDGAHRRIDALMTR